MQNKVYLALGSNTGDINLNLNKAVELISEKIGEVEKVSSFYITKPMYKLDQADFCNAVCIAYTSLDHFELLDRIELIMSEMGRVREESNGPRIIDIDILFFNNLKIKTEKLEIPHPKIYEREFVTRPLIEILL